MTRYWHINQQADARLGVDAIARVPGVMALMGQQSQGLCVIDLHDPGGSDG